MKYYFVMDDKANKSFNFDVEYGRVDFEIQTKPYEEEWSKPIDYIYDPNCPDVIYYNFVNKKQYINKINYDYDYYWYSHGFILSKKLATIFKQFKIQGHVWKKLKFTVNGDVMESPDFYLLKFNTYTKDNPAPDFIDYEKTESLPSKTIYTVSRKIVLKEDVDYDIFKPGRVELLAAAGFVVTEEVKEAIETNRCGRGIHFLPIETAQEEYCKNSFKDFTSLLKRAKPKLP